MIPKTEIIYSWIYNKQWNKDLPPADFLNLYKKIENIGKSKFEPLYKKYINKILNLIPKFTGYKWEESYIGIYLVKKQEVSSFSVPLTLYVCDDVSFMLTSLIHELIHLNFYPRKKIKMREPDFFARRFLEDMAVDLVTKKIVEKLNLSECIKIMDRGGNLKYRTKELLGNKKIKPLPINLDRETIKSSCLNNLLLVDLIEK